MHNLYDERIIDQYTDRNLLNWAVTTYQEGRYYQYDLAVLTTGIHRCCHTTLKLVEQVRNCQLGMW